MSLSPFDTKIAPAKIACKSNNNINGNAVMVNIYNVPPLWYTLIMDIILVLKLSIIYYKTTGNFSTNKTES